jgi:hypothetical protein
VESVLENVNWIFIVKVFRVPVISIPTTMRPVHKAVLFAMAQEHGKTTKLAKYPNLRQEVF